MRCRVGEQQVEATLVESTDACQEHRQTEKKQKGTRKAELVSRSETNASQKSYGKITKPLSTGSGNHKSKIHRQGKMGGVNARG